MASAVHVILARDVAHLGHIGNVVRVRPGYARNYLFPRGLALPASVEKTKQLEHQKKLIERQKEVIRSQSEELKARLAHAQVTITSKAGEQGKLFGSIGTRDIEVALKTLGYVISHRDIHLDKPIKQIGLHSVPVRLEGDVKGIVQVVVVPEEEQQPQAVDTNEQEDTDQVA